MAKGKLPVPTFDQDNIRVAVGVEITNAGVGRCLRNSFEWNDLKSRYCGKARKRKCDRK